MIQPVLAVVGHIQVVPAIIVIITDANTLSPACGDEARLRRDIGERAVVIVVVQMIRRSVLGGTLVERGAIHNENVGPAVVVVIKNCDPGTGSLDNVLLRIHAAEDIGHRETSFFGNVLKIRETRQLFG